jgi:hypothetical protein
MLPWRWSVHKQVIIFSKILLFSFVLHVVVLTMLFFFFKRDSVMYQVEVSLKNKQAGSIVVAHYFSKKNILKKTEESFEKSIFHEKQAKKLSFLGKQGVNKTTKEKKKKSSSFEKKNSGFNRSKNIVSKNKSAIKNANASTLVSKNNKALRKNAVEDDSVYVQEAVQRIVEKKWKPPFGVAKGVACSVLIHVNWDCSVREVMLTKSSGIVGYDVSVCSMLRTLKLPRCARGKTLKINFSEC